ncbi:MAG: DUF6071 family protein [Candidatus Binataceae bacterium]
MLLYANGCSMTWGDELSDAAESSYPSLIAKSFGIDLFNASLGGSSNCRILRTSMHWICEYLQSGGGPEELFVLIGWSAPDRREFALSSEEHTPNLNRFWRTLHIHHEATDATPDLVQLRKLIIKSFWCDRETMTRFLITVNSLQSFLVSNSIRFCFSHAMPFCELHPELVPLTRSVNRDRFFHFMDPKMSFSSYSRDAGVPIGALLHPLEEGHKRWATCLLDFIREKRLL